MKIAIPTFGTRVSPRFDCAESVLLVSIDNGTPRAREELVASGWAPHERINKLVGMGVDTVLCGGIDCWSAQSLQSAGVTIYGWVAGEIDEALAALLRGELDSDVQATTPGRWGCRRFPGDDRTGGRPGRGRGFGPRAGRGRRRDRDEGGTGPPPALRPPR